MRYVIVIFTLACIIIWDGWFNSGQWAEQFLRGVFRMLSYVGL